MIRQLTRKRNLWIGGILCMLVTVAIVQVRLTATDTVSVGSLTLTSKVYAADVSQGIDGSTAAAIGLQKVQELRPDVHGLQVSISHRANSLLQVADSGGNVIYSSTDGANVWVIELTGPPQSGFKTVTGAVVVDAATGKIYSASVLLTN